MIDLQATIKASYQQMVDGFQELRAAIWAITPTPAQSDRLKDLAASLDMWRDRLLAFLKPYESKWHDKLWLGGYLRSMWMPDSEKRAVWAGLQRYQVELSNLGDRFAEITGVKKPAATSPAPVLEQETLAETVLLLVALGVLAVAGVAVWRIAR